MTSQPLRGAIAQNVRNSPPAERGTCICQRKRHRAEPALEGIVADAQVELPNAVLVQGGHRSFDDEPAWRAMRPSFAGVADAQEHKVGPSSDAERGCNYLLAARQRRCNDITLFEASTNEVAIEFCRGFAIQAERQSKRLHALLWLRIGGVKQRGASSTSVMIRNAAPGLRLKTR